MSEEHHHPNYIKIWGILCVLLVISIFGPFLEIRIVTLITAFGIAIVKAYLVAAYFMHLKYEPFFVVLVMAVGLACLYFLFFGLVPDIVFSGAEVGNQ